MKALFVGLGSVGQRHLRNLYMLTGGKASIFAYRVRGNTTVLDDKLRVLENECLNEKYSIQPVGTLQEAFSIGMDCVFICNPSSMHMEVLQEALQHNCPVFVEKPLSSNENGLDEAIVKAKETGATVYVGYQNRLHPCVAKAKELLSQSAVGRVISATAEIGENVTQWHKYEDYRTMYACQKALGGGVVLSQIHEVDYLIYFLGMPKSVYAVGGHLSDLEMDVEDVVHILLAYEDEGGAHIPVSIHADYIQRPPARTCKILGTNGRIEFDLLSCRFVQYAKDGAVVYEEIFSFERNDMFLKEMELFLAAAEKRDTKTFIDLEEGAKSLKVALAAKESMNKGQVIEL